MILPPKLIFWMMLQFYEFSNRCFTRRKNGSIRKIICKCLDMSIGETTENGMEDWASSFILGQVSSLLFKNICFYKNETECMWDIFFMPQLVNSAPRTTVIPLASSIFERWGSHLWPDRWRLQPSCGWFSSRGLLRKRAERSWNSKHARRVNITLEMNQRTVRGLW